MKSEALRKAQKKYTESLYEKGYQRTNVWVPGPLMKSLKDEASKKGLSLQKFIVLSLEQLIQNEKT